MNKKGAFWKQTEIENCTLEPDVLYITHRGGKSQIRAHGVLSGAGADGQTVHWALSGWMQAGKAHQTVNAYRECYIRKGEHGAI